MIEKTRHDMVVVVVDPGHRFQQRNRNATDRQERKSNVERVRIIQSTRNGSGYAGGGGVVQYSKTLHETVVKSAYLILLGAVHIIWLSRFEDWQPGVAPYEK